VRQEQDLHAPKGGVGDRRVAVSEASGNERGSAGTLGARRVRRAPGSPWTSGLASLFAAAAIFGSCEDEQSSVVWPPGTVVAVDAVPVTADEIAQDEAAVLLVEPQWSDRQRKRLAFNELVLPRAILRARSTPEQREAALRSLEEQFARLASGTQAGPPTAAGAIGHEVGGSWMQLGLAVWGPAMNLEPGVWSEPFETPGAFVRVRVLERTEGDKPARTLLRLETLSVPFTSDPATDTAIDEMMRKHRLTIVDPAWETIVPERTQYLMGVHGP
jgi:hypothetical protein